MAYLLHIETSSNCCSVALSKDAVLLGLLEEVQANTHASSLPLFIQQLLSEHSLTVRDLAAVSVGLGPGSYTGLRVGVSLVKGLCFVHGIPLIGLSTLKIMAQGLKEIYPSFEGDFVPIVDARRMEVYTAHYDQNLNEKKSEYAYVVDESSWSEYHTQILFGGSAASKVKAKLIPNTRHTFDCESNLFSARFMCSLAFEKFRQNAFENLAYVEPLYLKEWGQL